MGKKRKHEDREEKIKKKIQKLNEKLNRRRRIISSSSDEDANCNEHSMNIAYPVEYVGEDQNTPGCSRETHLADMCEDTLAGTPTAPYVDDLLEAVANPGACTEAQATSEEVNLDTEVLELLGEAPESENPLGKPIHKDVAARWLDIVKKGLTKEIKEKLSKEYLLPQNCELLVPPILNPEAKAALTESFIKRDSSLVYRQKQISNVLAALAPVTEIIIAKNFDPELRLKLLKPINDACRILCDMHHNETMTRKKFVISSISTGLKDTLVTASTDKYLFGDNMGEKIKTAKNVIKTGESLKANQKIQKSNYIKNQLNFKTLHPKTAGRQDVGKNQPASRQFRQQNNRAPPRRAAPQRGPPRSPPRRRDAPARR